MNFCNKYAAIVGARPEVAFELSGWLACAKLHARACCRQAGLQQYFQIEGAIRMTV